MSLDLNKLENKLDEALSNETSKSLNKFLNDKRMTNDKQQTAVEWYIDELEKYEKGTSEYFSIPAIQNHARRMDKRQIINSFWNGDNTDCTSEQNIEEFAEQYYNETYGGGEQ